CRRLVANHLLGLSCAAVLSLTAGPAWAAGFKADLESHSFGSTNWSTANPTGYKELDYIPIRVVLTGGPATAKPITVQFDHTKTLGSRIIPAIQNLSSFSASSNVVITAGPTAVTPAGQDMWSYTFTINLTDNAPGYVEFRARLSAGSHEFTGASLHLSGSLALGTMSIIKVDAAPGAPDLSIV